MRLRGVVSWAHRIQRWSRGLIQTCVVLFCAAASLAVMASLVLRIPVIQSWSVRASARLLQEEGISAEYRIGLNLWPLALELREVSIPSTDGGAPFLESSRVRFVPDLLSLFTAHPVLRWIHIDRPRVRAVVREGKITNVDLPFARQEDEAFHAQFHQLVLSHGEILLDLGRTQATLSDVNAGVKRLRDTPQGSSLDIHLTMGAGEVHAQRFPTAPAVPGESTVFDDDMLCRLQGHGRLDPDRLYLDTLTLQGMADLDPQKGDALPCSLPAEDTRHVHVQATHLQLSLPTQEKPAWSLQGALAVRTPIALAKRVAPLPEMDGWVAFDLEGQYASGDPLPSFRGNLEGHELMWAGYAIGHTVHSTLSLHNQIVQSPWTEVALAGGVVTLTDTSFAPLEPGVPLHTQLDAHDLDFPSLMRDLGVSAQAHVGWKFGTLRSPRVAGTLSPLALDGAFSAKTQDFVVADRPVEDPSAKRIFGISKAAVDFHFALRPDAVQFQRLNITLPHSTVEKTFVSLGFDYTLQVDVPHAQIHLDELSPLVGVPWSGHVDLHANASGKMNAPRIQGAGTLHDFSWKGIQFGDVQKIQATLVGKTLSLDHLDVSKHKSRYTVPHMQLVFGGQADLDLHATVQTDRLVFRDLLSIFGRQHDPVFAEIEGILHGEVEVHVAAGGPEDRCGDGYIEVQGAMHGTSLAFYGEEFEEGDASFLFRWIDPDAGLPGAALDLYTAALYKVHEEGVWGTKGVSFGSATLQRGGALDATLVMDGLPLQTLQLFGTHAAQMEGFLSGVLRVQGKLEEFSTTGDITITPMRVQGHAFGASSLRLDARHYASLESPHTKTCRGQFTPPQTQGARPPDTYTLTGTMWGGQMQLDPLVLTKGRAPTWTGHVHMHKMDMVGLMPFVAGKDATPPDPFVKPASSLQGVLSGELDLLDVWPAALSKAQMRLQIHQLIVGGEKLALSFNPQSMASPIVMGHNVLSIPACTLTVQGGEETLGILQLEGHVTDLSSTQHLDIQAQLVPTFLHLKGLFPTLPELSGEVQGNVVVQGPLNTPSVHGDLHVRQGTLSPGAGLDPVTDLALDVVWHEDTIRLVRGTGRMKEGGLELQGAVRLAHFVPQEGTVHLFGHDLAFSPKNDLHTTLDTTLHLLWTQGKLPHLQGEVKLSSFSYTHPFVLAANSSSPSKPSSPERSTAPLSDSLQVDLTLRSKTPLVVQNNLVRAELNIAEPGLVLHGTDRQLQAQGTLHAVPGGRFFFRGNTFDLTTASIQFSPTTGLSPRLDLRAVTQYNRAVNRTGTSAGAANRLGGSWRIFLKARGDLERLRVNCTSQPSLSEDDIFLLLTLGLTQAELLADNRAHNALMLEVFTALTGTETMLQENLPLVDEVRMGSTYSPDTGTLVPQLTLGRQLLPGLRMHLRGGLSADSSLLGDMEWQLNHRFSVRGLVENNFSNYATSLGNIGVDVRWRRAFE